MGLPVGWQATVTRTATITVPYRCSSCGFQDTALIEGMGAGTGGGKYYSRDEASGQASAAAGRVIEQDARLLASAIACPRCGARARLPANLPHPMITAVTRQSVFIGAIVLFFTSSSILFGEWLERLLALVITAAICGALYLRRKKVIDARAAFVAHALEQAALWSVSPQRFPQQQRSIF